MRSILFLITRYYTLMLFLIMEIIAVSAVVRSHQYQEVRFFNTSSRITGKLLGYVNSVQTFINLGKNNKLLVEENTRLKQQLLYQQQFAADTSLPRRSEQYAFEYIPARIVNNSISKNINYITFNKGSKDGVEKGLGVVSANGVVGIITNVSEDFSLALSVISIKTAIGVRHRNTNALGSLRWDGSDPYTLQVDNLSKTLPIKVKDTIVTAGFSSIFPPDLPVAVVKAIEPDPSSSFFHCDVRLTSPIHRLSYAYIVKNQKKKQIDQLESQAVHE